MSTALICGYTQKSPKACQGWRRPIECLKVQVIFRKRTTNCRALLRKMTCKDKASYGPSPPCMGWLPLVGSLKL